MRIRWHHPWSRRWVLPVWLTQIIPVLALMWSLIMWAAGVLPAVWLLAVLGAGAALLPVSVHWYRTKNRVRHAKGRLCGNCLFPLEGLPMQGACPECGRRYSIKHTIACWKHDLGLNGKHEYRHWPELPKDDTP